MNETKPGLPKNVKVLGLASLLNDIASEMIYPLLPTFLLTVLKGDKLILGTIEGLADCASSLLRLWSGGRSDQVGRRKGFVLFGYTLAGITRPLIGIIWAPWQLLCLRIGDRIGKGIRTAPRDALIADSTNPELRGRAFGFHRGMDNLGAAIGPLLASAFLFFWPGEFSLLFLLTVIPGLAAIVVLSFGLQEPPRDQEKAAERMQLSWKPLDSNLRWFLLAVVLFTLGNSSDAFLLVRAGELGVPTYLLPILWCVFHVMKSSNNLLLGRAVDWFGARPLLLLGWGLYALIYLGFGLADAAWQAWGLFMVLAIYYGMAEPAERTLVANLAGADRKGLAFGWYNFAIGLATFPASVLFGALYQFGGSLPAFALGAALAVSAGVVLIFIRDKNSLEPSEPEATAMGNP